MIYSPRLIIRNFETTDYNDAFSWFSDPDVMKWIPSGPDINIMQTKDRLIKYIDHFKTYGFSKYILIEKSTGIAIGDAGPMHLDETNFIELGYRIKKTHWNQGVATEAAQCILKYLFESLLFQEIHSIVEPENLASVHIIENKLRFDFIKTDKFFNIPMHLYKIDKDKYFYNFT